MPASEMFFCLSNKTSKTAHIKKAAIPLVLLVMGLFPTPNLNFAKETSEIRLTQHLDEMKSNTALARWGLWEAAINLIKDKPLGIGPGEYEFTAIKYRTLSKSYQEALKDHGQYDQSMEKTPHNEYLRLSIEFGILYTILTALICCLIFYRYHTSNKDDPNLAMLTDFVIYTYM